MLRSLYIIILTFVLVATASAANLNQARANGHACEQTNGYLRATATAPGDVKSLVKSVNEQRKAKYTKIANKNGVEVNQVAKLTAEKLINKNPKFACK